MLVLSYNDIYGRKSLNKFARGTSCFKEIGEQFSFSLEFVHHAQEGMVVNMKKTVKVIIASALSFAVAMPAFAATFSDVTETNTYKWAYESVEDMAEKGLVSGYEDGTFKPGKSVSRMEAFALFARLMGSNSDVNKNIVEYAKRKYAAKLADYKLSYAEGDIAYMLYRGVLSESELDTYFKDEKKSEPMPRHEAAVLITKAMYAEERAKDEVLVDMDYTDIASIPKTARQYVYYVTQKGIMSGMGDGTFSPNTSVLRGQIAVMLSRTSDTVEYSFEKAKIAGIDTNVKNLSIVTDSGETETIGYSDNTVFMIEGEKVLPSQFVDGQNIYMTYIEDDQKISLAFADVLNSKPDMTITGIYQGYATKSGKVSINVKGVSGSSLSSYSCADDVKVLIDGKTSDVNKIKSGDYISFVVSDDEVISVSCMQKSETIKNAELENVDPLGTITIKHADTAYDGKTYALSSEAKIYKNGSVIDYSSLYRGDTLTITLEYGLVKTIVATSKTSTVYGTVKGYEISASPKLTIKTNGEEVTYDIPADVTVTINNQAAKLADFNIGDSVTLTIESNAVTKITATATNGTATNAALTGVVTGVNPSLNVIIISYDENGSKSTAYITCKSTTKFYILPAFSETTISKISEGDTVSAYGSYSNGVFMCTAVTIAAAQ